MVVIWSGISVLLYSGFLPLLETSRTVQLHTTAYYGALGAIERAQLVTRYKKPGFNGSWWRIGPNNIGPQSDGNNNDLWVLSRTTSHMRRAISSQTTQIPSTGSSNIPFVFADPSSSNYHTLTYNTTEKILLSIDPTTNPETFYTPTTNTVQEIGQGPTDEIQVAIRVNPFIYATWFNSPNFCFCDQDADGVSNDALVQRAIWGDVDRQTYRITPRENTDTSQQPGIILEWDTFIREQQLSGNPPETSLLFDNSRNPLSLGAESSKIQYYILVSPVPSLSWNTYSQLYQNSNLQNNYIELSLINRLLTQDKEIFPFLEYSMDFGERKVADRYYYIDGVGRAGEYEVRLRVQKPTTQETTTWNFTVLF